MKEDDYGWPDEKPVQQRGSAGGAAAVVALLLLLLFGAGWLLMGSDTASATRVGMFVGLIIIVLAGVRRP